MPEFQFNEQHLERFLALPYTAQGAFGEPPAQWAKDMGLSVRGYKSLPSEQLSRSTLKQICRDEPVLHAYLCVMAWGLQGRGPNAGKNARMVWEGGKDDIKKILERLEKYDFQRADAYELFKNKNSNKIPGLGAAYFTKLLYFFGVKGAYIMDQWTTKSVSLLVKDTVVKHGKNGHPYVSNSGKNYDKFCSVIDELAKKSGKVISGEKVEQKLFCIGSIRRGPRGPWRQYVKDEWEKL